MNRSFLLALTAAGSVVIADHAGADFTGIQQVIATDENVDVDLPGMGLVAWRFYATFSDPGDVVNGLFGDAFQGSTLGGATTDCDGYWDPDSADYLVDAAQLTSGDSFITIGTGPPGGPFPSISPGFPDLGFGQLFQGEVAWEIDGEEGIFVSPGFAGTSVLLAQFVVGANHSVSYYGILAYTEFQGPTVFLPFSAGGLSTPDRCCLPVGMCIDTLGSCDNVAGTVLPDCSVCTEQVCPPCPDIDGSQDGTITFDDLAILLGAWGPCIDLESCLAAPLGDAPACCRADFIRDGEINFDDLGVLLGGWGECQP